MNATHTEREREMEICLQHIDLTYMSIGSDKAANTRKE